jgi:sugar phosphate isomerase/epimerase
MLKNYVFAVISELTKMFVGLLTSPLSRWNLQRLVDWAADNRFKGLEVAVSPTLKQLDVGRILSGGASTVRRLVKGKDLEITSLAFYSLTILGKPEDQVFLEKAIEACSALDVKVLCTLAGGPVAGKSKRQTLREDFPTVFNPIGDKAREHGLKIAFENWFATNLQNLEHFELAFEVIPDKTLGLNFDPSHLFWQQIDYLEAVHRFGNRIYHTHAKDTEILQFKLRQVGVLDSGWWRYRIPGWGNINWRAYLTALKESNYDYVLSIEHEDPFFPPEEGFLDGKRYLEGLLI